MKRAEVKFQQAEDDPAKPRDGGYLSIDAPDGFSGFRPAVNLHKARVSGVCRTRRVLPGIVPGIQALRHWFSTSL
jgi:hypothetical protein